MPYTKTLEEQQPEKCKECEKYDDVRHLSIHPTNATNCKLKPPVSPSVVGDWVDRFKNEFGIHFKDSTGELGFALAFIEEEIERGFEKGMLKGYARQDND